MNPAQEHELQVYKTILELSTYLKDDYFRRTFEATYTEPHPLIRNDRVFSKPKFVDVGFNECINTLVKVDQAKYHSFVQQRLTYRNFTKALDEFSKDSQNFVKLQDAYKKGRVIDQKDSEAVQPGKKVIQPQTKAEARKPDVLKPVEPTVKAEAVKTSEQPPKIENKLRSKQRARQDELAKDQKIEAEKTATEEGVKAPEVKTVALEGHLAPGRRVGIGEEAPVFLTSPQRSEVIIPPEGIPIGRNVIRPIAGGSEPMAVSAPTALPDQRRSFPSASPLLRFRQGVSRMGNLVSRGPVRNLASNIASTGRIGAIRGIPKLGGGLNNLTSGVLNGLTNIGRAGAGGGGIGGILRGNGSGGRLGRIGGMAKKSPLRIVLIILLLIIGIFWLVGFFSGQAGDSRDYNLSVFKTKSGPDKINNGEEITYNIQVSFTGPANADIEVTDVLDLQKVEFIKTEGKGSLTDNTVKWMLANIPPNQPQSLTLTVRPTQENSWVMNRAVAKIAKKYQQDHGTLAKSGDKQVENGQLINYELTVTYTGQGTADIEVTDRLDPQTSFERAGEGGEHANGVVKWLLTGVLPNQPKKLTLTAKPAKEDIYVQNTAEAKITAKVPSQPGNDGDNDNEPVNQETCGGGAIPDFPNGYKINNPVGNFGDPSCSYSKDKLYELLQKEDPANADYWFNTVVRCESGYSPNAYADPIAVGTPDAAGAWGLFQMGRGKNGQYDHGDVTWRLQTINAVNYNKNLKTPWRYWQCARDRW